MDCEMPIKNGYEASVEIKLLVETKNLKNVIIYALTSYVD